MKTKKYKFNKAADKYLQDLYDSFGAKTNLQKTKVIESVDKLEQYNITHCKRGDDLWLAVIEHGHLQNKQLIDVIYC